MPRFYKIQTLLARFFWLDHKVIGLQYALTFLPLIGFSLAVLFRTRLSGLAGMRVKQDAIPGVEQRLWFTPTKIGEWEIACSGSTRLKRKPISTPGSQANQRDFERSNESSVFSKLMKCASHELRLRSCWGGRVIGGSRFLSSAVSGISNGITPDPHARYESEGEWPVACSISGIRAPGPREEIEWRGKHFPHTPRATGPATNRCCFALRSHLVA
jgi:hypothetical protein